MNTPRKAKRYTSNISLCIEKKFLRPCIAADFSSIETSRIMVGTRKRVVRNMTAIDIALLNINEAIAKDIMLKKAEE